MSYVCAIVTHRNSHPQPGRSEEGRSKQPGWVGARPWRLWAWAASHPPRQPARGVWAAAQVGQAALGAGCVSSRPTRRAGPSQAPIAAHTADPCLCGAGDGARTALGSRAPRRRQVLCRHPCFRRLPGFAPVVACCVLHARTILGLRTAFELQPLV